MSDFRSQLKATSMKSLKKRIDQDDNMVGSQKSEYLQLEDGKTLKIRIFPAHPGMDDFYVPRKCYWLSFTGQDGDNYRGTVNDSRLHGGTKYDLVEEYVKFAKKKIGDDADKLNALVGNGPKSNSLNPRYSWLCYAAIVRPDEELHPMVWEFGKMVRDQINKLACSENFDEAIEVDPFTDPDEGMPINVTYNKNPNKKKGENYYDVAFPAKSKARPLTDSEIESFMAQKPLNELLSKYGIADFNRALDGLQNFDQENDINLFEDEDWLEHVEQIKSQYDETEEEEEPKKKTSVKKPVVKDEDDDEEDDEEEESSKGSDDADEFDDMDRTELKKYINDNELEISVKKSMSDDDLRNAIREATNQKADSKDEDEEEEEDDEDVPAPKSRMTLEDIKKKLGKK